MDPFYLRTRPSVGRCWLFLPTLGRELQGSGERPLAPASIPLRREIGPARHGVRASGQPPRLPAPAPRRAGPAAAVRPADLRGRPTTPAHRAAPSLWPGLSAPALCLPGSAPGRPWAGSPLYLSLQPITWPQPQWLGRLPASFPLWRLPLLPGPRPAAQPLSIRLSVALPLLSCWTPPAILPAFAPGPCKPALAAPHHPGHSSSGPHLAPLVMTRPAPPRP